MRKLALADARSFCAISETPTFDRNATRAIAVSGSPKRHHLALLRYPLAFGPAHAVPEQQRMDDSLYFSEQHLAVREMVRSFAREHVAPVAAKHDADSTFPWENVKAMGELGLLGIPWPEEIGGAGFDTLSFMIAIEELARVDASHSITISAHTTLGTSPIVNFGTQAQIERYVPLLASGKVLAWSAVSMARR